MTFLGVVSFVAMQFLHACAFVAVFAALVFVCEACSVGFGNAGSVFRILQSLRRRPVGKKSSYPPSWSRNRRWNSLGLHI